MTGTGRVGQLRRWLGGPGDVPSGADGGDAERRARLRAVARQHHPDRGGDVETYLAAVAAVDRAHAGDATSTGPRPTGRRRVRAVVRAARSRLPRRFPGRRRYARL